MGHCEAFLGTPVARAKTAPGRAAGAMFTFSKTKKKFAAAAARKDELERELHQQQEQLAKVNDEIKECEEGSHQLNDYIQAEKTAREVAEKENAILEHELQEANAELEALREKYHLSRAATEAAR